MSMYQKLRTELQRTYALSRAVTFVWESSARWTIISLILLLVLGLLPILSLYMMKLIVDAVSQTLLDPGVQGFRQVLIFILLAGGVTLFTSIVRSFYNLVSKEQGRRVADHMQDILQAKAIAVDLEFYENAAYHDTLHRAQREASYRPISIVNSLMLIARSAVSLLGIAWLLFAVHWSLGVIMLVAVLPRILIRLRYSRKTYHTEREFTKSERRSWYYGWMMISTDYAKEVRIFGLGDTFRREYQKLRKVIRKIMYRLDYQRSLFETLGHLISVAAVYGSYAFIAYQTIQGTNTLGDLVMYYQAFQRGQGFLNDLLGGVASLYENNLFLSNLYEFLDIQNNISEPEAPKALPAQMKDGISFRDVWFQYPGSTKDVIRGVNMDIRPGEVVALVGENGSGKTTLVKLLCRLYDPNSGGIKIDGVELSQFATESLRKVISVIFQDYAQYNLTARENIWLGNVGRDKYDPDVESAAEHAGIADALKNLNNGYDTVLGRLFEYGEELSIGQWQKVALARAFYRNSQVIVLDEPTSAMDPKAEYEVFLKFRELLEGRTAILISHRLSTVRMADRIYVLNDGQILEHGTHKELLQKRGAYAVLFERQAESYRD